MKTVILVPARFASSRYHGKPLAKLRNGLGQVKTLIQRSWDAACAVRRVDAVYVATDDDLVVNLQGDAPLTPPWFVEVLIEEIRRDSTIKVATPVLRCDSETYAHFVTDRLAGRVGGTTAIFDQAGAALYFSKEVISYINSDKVETAFRRFFIMWAFMRIERMYL